MESDDLDEEFAQLQRELIDVAKNTANDNEESDRGLVSETSQEDKPIETGSRPREDQKGPTVSRVVVAADDAITITPRPAWQQELLERDLQRLNATAALHGDASPAPQKLLAEQVQPASAGLDPAPAPVKRPVQQQVGAGGEHRNTPTPQGRWVWDGTRWQWVAPLRPAAASVSGTAASIAASAQPTSQLHSQLPASADVSHAQEAASNREASATRKRAARRMAAGDVWVDKTLADWPENDFRIFVGDLAPDATEKELVDAFRNYRSFNMARVVLDKKTGKCRGYGFVSFAEGEDMVTALKEMNGKYVGSRPVKLKKSNWQKRNLAGNRKKELKLFRTIVKPKR